MFRPGLISGWANLLLMACDFQAWSDLCGGLRGKCTKLQVKYIVCTIGKTRVILNEIGYSLKNLILKLNPTTPEVCFQ
jgi:hypothetical protein